METVHHEESPTLKGCKTKKFNIKIVQHEKTNIGNSET